MKTLDCETIDTTYSSLRVILGLSRERLIALFGSINPDALNARCPQGYFAQQRYLSLFIQKETGCSAEFDATCWFHCTRIWECAFEDGLLPHSLVQERIWDFIYGLVQDQFTGKQWQQVREKARSSTWYAERLSGGSYEDGPFGLLVRESATVACRSRMFVDYFDLPELVDNICRLPDLQGIDLREKYQVHTRPTIVKFRTRCHRPEELHVALFYAYRKYHGLDVGESCNWPYNGKSRAIPKGAILKVEYVAKNKR